MATHGADEIGSLKMRSLLGVALAGLLALGVAGSAGANIVSYSGSLTFGLSTLPGVAAMGGGSADVNGSAGWLPIATLALTAGGLGPVTASVPVTNNSTINSVIFTAMAVGTGTPIQGGAGAAFGITGVAKICLVFAPCAYAAVPVVLTPSGSPPQGLGVGGTQTVMGAVDITMQHAPWTLGTPTMSIHSANSNVTLAHTTTTQGANVNKRVIPGGFPATPSGLLQLVTATKTFTSLSGAFPELPITAVLQLQLAPEPGSLLLLLSGGAGAALMGGLRGRRSARRKALLALLVLVALGAVVLWTSSAMAGPSPTPTPTVTPTPTPTPTVTPTPTPTPAPGLDKQQQACVNTMNKSGEKVNKAQLKEIEKCLKDFQKEKLTDFDQCTVDDRKQKVAKAEGKTLTQEDNRCDSLPVLPPFAYTSGVAVNGAAVERALAVIDTIFGTPAANLVTKNKLTGNRDTAKCQMAMLKEANKLESTVVKEVNKAKKGIIKDPAIDSGDALKDQLAVVLSSNDKIIRAKDKLLKQVSVTDPNKGQCKSLVNPAGVFAGACTDGDLANVADCVVAASVCEACRKINLFDGLDIDCDQADNGSGDGSCPPLP